MEHSKAPWTIQESLSNNNFFIYAQDKKEPIAGVLHYVADNEGKEGKANANLIVTSPELLEVCKEVLNFLHCSVPLGQGFDDLLIRNQIKLQNVIAKAEGK